MSKLKSMIKRVFNSNAAEKKNPAPFFPVQMVDAECTPELIAKGTFGSVYKVRHNGMTAALKVIACPTAYELDLAKKECRIMQSVASIRHTVTYLDSFIQTTANGHTVYILQEYLLPFEQYYNSHKMSPSDIIELGMCICMAMRQCRDAGFYHLDIQPKNIFVAEDGCFKLGDFGSAVYLTELNEPQPLRGTPAYMAPEVYESRLYSQSSDIYSLGILLYSLLNNGILPFRGYSDSENALQARMEFYPLVPPILLHKHPNNALSEILQSAYHPDHTQRLQVIEELEKGLELALIEEFGASSQQTYKEMILDLGASSVNLTQPIPQIFDADFFACTCALDVPLFDTDADGIIDPPPFIFDADSYAYSCALCEPDPVPAPKISEVQFSAIAPETAVKGDYTLVQLYMYEQDYAYIVDDAVAEADEPVIRKNSGFFEVEQHARVKVVLTSADVEIMEGEAEQVWYGKYLAFDFAFELPYQFSKKQILLKAAVYINDFPATRLLLKLKVGTSQDRKIEVERQDVSHVYMSYAREDQAKVAGLVQAIQAVRPEWNVFFDVYSLKCGSDWEQSLYKNLDICDTLFLCWSRAAGNSPWVEKEWRYMLNSKGPDSIEPMPVEPTELCPPPKELSMKYFNNSLLYLSHPFDNV